jgi:hypothetical protein
MLDEVSWRYSFGVMIVLNFVLFVLIAVGQLSIWIAVKTSSQALRVTPRLVINPQLHLLGWSECHQI